MMRFSFKTMVPVLAMACLTLPACDSGSSDDDGSSSAGEASTSSGEASGSGNDSADGSGTGASTTGATDGSSTGATTSSTSGGFVMVDGGVMGGCVPGKLDDCPEGEKCSAYVMEPGYCCVDTNACVPVIGDKAWGDDCTRTEMNDDCDNGLFCMTITSGSTGVGACLQLCEVANTTDCADKGLPNANCVSFNDGVLPLCEDPCDPLAQDCEAGFGCYAVGTQGFTCTLPGFDDAAGNDADECFTVQSCKPGLVCTDGAAVAGCNADTCCTQFCDTSIGNSECTDPMEVCENYFEPGTELPGYETVGVCAIPQ